MKKKSFASYENLAIFTCATMLQNPYPFARKFMILKGTT